MLQKHNKEQHPSSTQTTLQTLRPQGAPSISTTYLFRDENSDGRMSKQKTASASTGLRDTEGQREDPTGAEAAAQGEHRKRMLAKQRAVRLDPPAAVQAGLGELPNIWLCAIQWVVQGGTFWDSWWNTSQGGCSGALMKHLESISPCKRRSEQLTRTSDIARLSSRLGGVCQVVKRPHQWCCFVQDPYPTLQVLKHFTALQRLIFF